MEIDFKMPQRKQFLVEAGEYFVFAPVFRDLYSCYRDEKATAWQFFGYAFGAAICASLLFWTLFSGPMTTLTWILLSLQFANGRRDRDAELQRAATEIAIQLAEGWLKEANEKLEKEKEEK